jgi:tRNA(Ile)-lysidine synthase
LRDIGFVHIENALRVAREGTAGDQATLPSGLMLTVGYDRLTVADSGVVEPPSDWPLLPPNGAPLPVALPGATPLPESGWMLHAELLTPADLPSGWEENADPWRAFFDARGASGGLWLRTRRPGDHFRPLGMSGHEVKLSHFFTNHKVPRVARGRIPLLVGEGGILWVCGLRLDERVRVDAGTEQIVAVRLGRSF